MSEEAEQKGDQPEKLSASSRLTSFQEEEWQIKPTDMDLCSACSFWCDQTSLANMPEWPDFGEGTTEIICGHTGHRLICLPEGGRAILSSSEDGVSVKLFGPWAENLRERKGRWGKQQFGDEFGNEPNLWKLIKLGWAACRNIGGRVNGKITLGAPDIQTLIELGKMEPVKNLGDLPLPEEKPRFGGFGGFGFGSSRDPEPDPNQKNFACTFPFLLELSKDEHITASFSLKEVEHEALGKGVQLGIHGSAISEEASTNQALRRQMLERLPLTTEEGQPTSLWDACNCVHEHVRTPGTGLGGKPLSWSDPRMEQLRLISAKGAINTARLPQVVLWQHWGLENRIEILTRLTLLNPTTGQFLKYLCGMLNLDSEEVKEFMEASEACRTAWTKNANDQEKDGAVAHRLGTLRDAIPQALKPYILPIAPPAWCKGLMKEEGQEQQEGNEDKKEEFALGFLEWDSDKSAWEVRESKKRKLTGLSMKIHPPSQEKDGDMDVDPDQTQSRPKILEGISARTAAMSGGALAWGEKEMVALLEANEKGDDEGDNNPSEPRLPERLADCGVELQWGMEAGEYAVWKTRYFWRAIEIGGANGFFVNEAAVRELIARVAEAPEGRNGFDVVEAVTTEKDQIRQLLQSGCMNFCVDSKMGEFPEDRSASRRELHPSKLSTNIFKRTDLEAGEKALQRSLKAPHSSQLVRNLSTIDFGLGGGSMELSQPFSTKDHQDALRRNLREWAIEAVLKDVRNNAGNGYVSLSSGWGGNNETEEEFDQRCGDTRKQGIENLLKHSETIIKSIVGLRAINKGLPMKAMKYLRDNWSNPHTAVVLFNLEGPKDKKHDVICEGLGECGRTPQFWSQCLGWHRVAWQHGQKIAAKARLEAARAADGVVHTFLAFAAHPSLPADLLAELWMWYALPEASILTMSSWDEIHKASRKGLSMAEEEEEGEEEEEEDQQEIEMANSDRKVLEKLRFGKGVKEMDQRLRDLITDGPSLFSWMPSCNNESGDKDKGGVQGVLAARTQSVDAVGMMAGMPMPSGEEHGACKFRANEDTFKLVLAREGDIKLFDGEDWRVLMVSLHILGSSKAKDNDHTALAKDFIGALWRLKPQGWPHVIKVLREILSPSTSRFNHHRAVEFGKALQRLMLWWFPEFNAVKDPAPPAADAQKDVWVEELEKNPGEPRKEPPIGSPIAATILDIAELLILSQTREKAFVQDYFQRGQRHSPWYCLQSRHNAALTDARITYLLTDPESLPCAISALEGVDLEGSVAGQKWKLEGELRNILVHSIVHESNEKLNLNLVDRLSKVGVGSAATLAFACGEICKILKNMRPDSSTPIDEGTLRTIKDYWERLLDSAIDFKDPHEKIAEAGQQIESAMIGSLTSRVLHTTLGQHTQKRYFREHQIGWTKGPKSNEALLGVLPMVVGQVQGWRVKALSAMNCLTPHLKEAPAEEKGPEEKGKDRRSSAQEKREKKAAELERKRLGEVVREAVGKMKSHMEDRLREEAAYGNLIDCLLKSTENPTLCKVSHVSHICTSCYGQLNLMKCRLLLACELGREELKVGMASSLTPLTDDDKAALERRFRAGWRRLLAQSKTLRRSFNAKPAVYKYLGDFSKSLLGTMKKEGIPETEEEEEAAKKWQEHLARVKARSAKKEQKKEQDKNKGKKRARSPSPAPSRQSKRPKGN